MDEEDIFKFLLYSIHSRPLKPDSQAIIWIECRKCSFMFIRVYGYSDCAKVVSLSVFVSVTSWHVHVFHFIPLHKYILKCYFFCMIHVCTLSIHHHHHHHHHQHHHHRRRHDFCCHRHLISVYVPSWRSVGELCRGRRWRNPQVHKPEVDQADIQCLPVGTCRAPW